MTPAHTIQRVKEATDLARLVGEYVPLKKMGSRWVGLCCFHKEDTPSFGVNVNGWFKCFGCGIGGDCFSFLMKVEGISFHDALKRMADAAGISLDAAPVSKQAQRLAQENAAVTRWAWERRRERLLDRVRAAMETEDDEMLEIIAMPLRAHEALSITERGLRVTERERVEWRAVQAGKREFAETWMRLADL